MPDLGTRNSECIDVERPPVKQRPLADVSKRERRFRASFINPFEWWLISGFAGLLCTNYEWCCRPEAPRRQTIRVLECVFLCDSLSLSGSDNSHTQSSIQQVNANANDVHLCLETSESQPSAGLQMGAGVRKMKQIG